MKISKGTVVEIDYKLFVDDPEEKELIEDTTEEGPLAFLFGAEPLLPRLEQALEGLEPGQEFSIAIPCDEAFGEEEEEAFITIPISDFVVDGELDEEMLEEGAVIPFEDADKEIIYGTVVERRGEEVVVDMNHPLAGEDLIYEGVIRSVREATAAEMAAGEALD